MLPNGGGIALLKRRSDVIGMGSVPVKPGQAQFNLSFVQSQLNQSENSRGGRNFLIFTSRGGPNNRGDWKII